MPMSHNKKQLYNRSIVRFREEAIKNRNGTLNTSESLLELINGDIHLKEVLQISCSQLFHL